MKDQRVEQWLDSFKVKYSYLDALPLAKLTIDTAAKVNIRMTEKVDEELVMRYAVALENKSEFPGIVVFKVGDHYGLINGWHRTEAFKYADRKTIPAYVVDVTDKLIISVLRRTANTLEGKPPSMAEMIEQAAFLVAQGYSVADASRLMSCPRPALHNRVQLSRVYARLAGMKLEPSTLRIPTTAMIRLEGLKDVSFKDVAILSHEARLPVDRAVELIRQVREAGSEADAKQIIAEWRATYAEQIQRNQGGRVRDPASGLRRLPSILKQTERLMVKHGDRVETLGAKDADRLITACRRTIKELEGMIARLEEVVTRG